MIWKQDSNIVYLVCTRTTACKAYISVQGHGPQGQGLWLVHYWTRNAWLSSPFIYATLEDAKDAAETLVLSDLERLSMVVSASQEESA